MNGKPIDGIQARRQPAPVPVTKTQRPAKRRRTWLIAAAVCMVVLVLTVIVLFYHKPANLNDVRVVQGLVSRHMLLPSGETPALATITDKTKLTTPFLQQADNGDKLLIYQKAKKVIIYRPSIDRIVDTGPVNIAASQP